MNYNNFTSFYLCLIFTFGYILSGVEPFVPAGRVGHSSILVGNRIYFFGGVKNVRTTFETTNEVFYLDLSQSFNATNPPWTQVDSLPFGSAFASVALDNSNNADLYLFGGRMIDLNTKNDSFISFIYKSNVNNLIWNIPNVGGPIPERRTEMIAVSDNSRKIHIFGGIIGKGEGSPDIYYNNMVDFDITSSSWSINNNTSVKSRVGYTATLLPSGVIVYIGGYEPLNENSTLAINSDISQIYLYDTRSLTWSTMSARSVASTSIDNRHYHSAVLAPNGQIIVYGGSHYTANLRHDKSSPDVIVLDTQKNPYEFTVPSLSTNIGAYPSLESHTANLYRNCMIVAFGNITQQNAEPLVDHNPNIYVMDIRSFTWITMFNPNDVELNPSSSSSSVPSNDDNNNNNNNNNKTIIILASVFGVLGGAILLVCGYFIYKWIVKRRIDNSAPGFPGTAEDYENQLIR